MTFHWRTPLDVIIFLRDLHNKWDDALGLTWLIVLTNSRDHNQSFLAYAKAKVPPMTSRSLGGANAWAMACWKYVQETLL